MKFVWLLLVVLGWVALSAEKEKLTEANVKGSASEQEKTYEIKEKLWLKDVKHEVVVSWIRIMLAWIGRMAAAVLDFFLNFGSFLEPSYEDVIFNNMTRIADSQKRMEKTLDILVKHIGHLTERLDPPKPQSTSVMIRRTTCYVEGTPEHLLEAIQFSCNPYIESHLVLEGEVGGCGVSFAEYAPTGHTTNGFRFFLRTAVGTGGGASTSFFLVPQLVSVAGFGQAGVVQGTLASFLQAHAVQGNVFTTVFAALQAAGINGINSAGLIGVGAWLGLLLADLCDFVWG